MKKEKSVRSYTRRTKSGKTVVVRQHTSKYDASEKEKAAAKKHGAGKELEGRVKNKYTKSEIEALDELGLDVEQIEKASKYWKIPENHLISWYAGNISSFSRSKKFSEAGAEKADRILYKKLGAKLYDSLDDDTDLGYYVMNPDLLKKRKDKTAPIDWRKAIKK